MGLVVPEPIDEAETTRVVIAQDDAVLEHQVHMVVLPGQLTEAGNTQATGHAQVPQQGALFAHSAAVVRPGRGRTGTLGAGDRLAVLDAFTALARQHRQQQVLGATANLAEAGADQTIGEILRHRHPQARLAHQHLTDLAPLYVGGDAAPGGLDFGKLWHGTPGAWG